jgi:hypothetical protein
MVIMEAHQERTIVRLKRAGTLAVYHPAGLIEVWMSWL